MDDSDDHAVITWDPARPRLSKERRLRFQLVKGRPTHAIEDSPTRGYHQAGFQEYRYPRAFDGGQPAAKLPAENSKTAGALSESEHPAGLPEKPALLRRGVAALEIRVAIPGRLRTPDLDSAGGRFMQPGEVLAAMLPDHPPEVLISIRQADFERVAEDFTADPGPFRVRIHDRPGEHPILPVRSSLREVTFEAHPDPCVWRVAGDPVGLPQPRFTLYASLDGGANFLEGQWSGRFTGARAARALAAGGGRRLRRTPVRAGNVNNSKPFLAPGVEIMIPA